MSEKVTKCKDCGEKVDPNASNTYFIESENAYFCRHCRDNFVTCGGCGNLFRERSQGGFIDKDKKGLFDSKDYHCDACLQALPDDTPIFLINPPSTQKLYEQAVADDKFSLRDNGRVEQLYFNPDGYGEKGQYVSNIIYTQDILKAVDNVGGSVEDFFDFLGSICKQYLYDNDGSDDFTDMDEHYKIDKWDLIGCTAETMNALIEFARKTEGIGFI